MIAFSLLVLISCKDKDPIDECPSSVSTLELLVDSLTGVGYEDVQTMDLEIHEYTFRLNQNQEVCKIGYQSQSAIETSPYMIQLIKADDGSVIYSGRHTFSSQRTEYVIPHSKIYLQAGTNYTIRRMQNTYKSGIADVIGRICVRQDSMEFPYIMRDMTVLSSNFYQNGGPAENWGIPFIDLWFK